MKKFISFALTVVILSGVVSVICGASAMPEKENVVSLMRDWEMLYLKYYDKQLFADIMYENGKPETEKRDYLIRKEGKEYNYINDDYVIKDPTGGYDDLLALFETVFTKETAKKALNNSNLMFDDDGSYLSSVVYAGGQPPFIDRDIELLKRTKGAKDLIDRITLTDEGGGIVKVDYTYYVSGDDEEHKASLKIKNGADGWRISELDGLLFKEDGLADEGYRKYRLAENDNPHTADAPVIAVCVLALSAAAAAVLVKKKHN